MKRTKTYFSSAGAVMSKMKKGFFALFIAGLSVFGVSLNVSGQDVSIRINLPANSTVIEVEGSFLARERIKFPRNFAFTKSGINTHPNAENIFDLILYDKSDRSIPTVKLKAGEYLADAEASKFSYKIDIGPTSHFTNKAHSSWVDREHGILMLRDLLPQMVSVGDKGLSAKIRLDLPNNWKVSTAERPDKDGKYEISNFETAVFIVGKNWRPHTIALDGVGVSFAIAGEWHFSDEESTALIGEILPELKRIFGEYPNEFVQITLVPAVNHPGRWEAETRGNSVTIVSGDLAFKKPSLQRLHEQLRHELIHLWVPNRLALTGNYDWFYEGFSIYQSLKTGVALNRLSFDDFLETLSEAIRITNSQGPQISLIHGSKTRTSGANHSVYARGMLIAFLCDAAILSNSRGRRSVSDILRKVYENHRVPNDPQDGNMAILSILSAYHELQPIIMNYLEGTKTVGWDNYLRNVGIEQIPEKSSARLKVLKKPTRRQKDLLDKLGYNNWRKIGRELK